MNEEGRKEGRKNHQPENFSHATKINIKILKNCKRIKHQPIREEKPIKHKTTNKSRPELAQVDSPNPKLKEQDRNQSALKKIYKKRETQFF